MSVGAHEPIEAVASAGVKTGWRKSSMVNSNWKIIDLDLMGGTEPAPGSHPYASRKYLHRTAEIQSMRRGSFIGCSE